MRDKTILDILEDVAFRLPDKTAIIEEKRRLSYGELVTRSKALGTAICKKLGGGGVTF